MVSTFGLTVGSHGQPTNDQESGSTLVVKENIVRLNEWKGLISY